MVECLKLLFIIFLLLCAYCVTICNKEISPGLCYPMSLINATATLNTRPICSSILQRCSTFQNQTPKKKDTYSDKVIYETFLLLLAPDLMNQHIVDLFAKIEGERVLYCRLNKKILRSEQFCHLKDALNNDNVDNIGNLVILPSSHTGIVLGT